MPQQNITPEEAEEMRKLRAEGKTGREIAEWIGCSLSTVFTHLNGVKRPRIAKQANARAKAYRDRIRADPEKFAAYKEAARQRGRRHREKLRNINLALKEAAE